MRIGEEAKVLNICQMITILNIWFYLFLDFVIVTAAIFVHVYCSRWLAYQWCLIIIIWVELF